MSYDELEAAGLFGLADAIHKKGVDIDRPYAITRIRGAIVDSLRQADYLSRRARTRVRSVEQFDDDEEAANALSISVEAVKQIRSENVRVISSEEVGGAEEFDSQDETIPPIEEILDSKRQHEWLYERVNTLPDLTDKERAALQLDLTGEQQKDIATEIGVCPARVSQLIKQAKTKLKVLATTSNNDQPQQAAA